jgi:3-hydroxyacyl-CoA dehydrogenase
VTSRYEVSAGVAIVTLDNPPVNGLGLATRRGIVGAIDRANQDPDVVAIVITGAGKGFSAGADIHEFDGALAMKAPTLPAVCRIVESSAKPVVAAVHAMALGGGLELALAANYRISAAGTVVGLPEVKLGILPGAGGTQRLPRAVGLETALNMMVAGETMKVEQLAKTRLFDRIVSEDLLTAATRFAREVAAQGGSHPRVRDWRIDHPNSEGFLAFARAAVAAATKNYPAPLKIVAALEAAVSRPFEEGLALEFDSVQALVHTPESKALRHAFFAERAATKIPDVGDNVKPREVRTVAIIGAGTMGGGISMNFLNAGIPVTLIEVKDDALQRGVDTIRRNYEATAKKGRLTRQQVEQRMGSLRPTLDFADARDADLIIEAVFEEYGVKAQVFRQMDSVAKPTAILATNTSTLDVDRIAQFTKRPRSVLGMHFFSPANVMRLLEVVRGKETATEVLATAMSVASRLRKTAVVSGVCDGFIGNRMVEQYFRQATFLLDEGALPHEVDKAVEAFGFAMGPFRMSDLAGNDISWAVRKRRYVERPDLTQSKVPDLICERGRFGQKTGAGWYDYKAGDRTAYPSREVEELIVGNSKDLKLERRRIDPEEIVNRVVYALVNEGARILEEGIAARASDIDIVYLSGYGFPAWRGGPMFYADMTGLYNVLRQIQHYAQGYYGQAWDPAPLLLRLVDEGRNFT